MKHKIDAIKWKAQVDAYRDVFEGGRVTRALRSLRESARSSSTRRRKKSKRSKKRRKRKTRSANMSFLNTVMKVI